MAVKNAPFPSGRHGLNENRLQEWKYRAHANILNLRQRLLTTKTDCSHIVIWGPDREKFGNIVIILISDPANKDGADLDVTLTQRTTGLSLFS